MTTQVNTKVRLVKCPKCRNVLEESPEISLYKCGGCGTILQAKIRKPEITNSELPPQETDSVARSQNDDGLGQNEARSSNHEISGSSKVESSPDRSVSEGLSSSRDVTSSPSEGSSIQIDESLECNPLGQDHEGYQSELYNEKGEGEGNAGPILSNELSSSCEITREDEAHSPEASEPVENHSQIHLHQDLGADQKEDVESQKALEEGDDLVDEVQNLSEHEDQESDLPERVRDNFALLEDDEKSHTCSVDQNGELAHENDTIPPSDEQVQNDSPGHSTFRSSNKVKDANPRASRRSFNGSLVSFYLTSDDEHMDHSPREVARDFERVNSMDMLGSSPHADLNSELNSRLGSMANFPTNGSYYAYDGSESSYDGTDYQVRGHIVHPSRKNRGGDYPRATEGLGKDGFRGNTAVNMKPERATSSLYRPMRSSHRNRGVYADTDNYTNGNRMRVDKQEEASLPFSLRTSGCQHNALPPRPGFNIRDKPSYSDPDKIDLLRTVYELKDQLYRMQFPKAALDRRFPDGKFVPYHHVHLTPDREQYAELSHPSGYSNHVKACEERCNASRLAYSGEAAHYRRPVSCSCMHYSAQLPSCPMHCKNSHHLVHTDHNCRNISNSPSPQHYTSSELSLYGNDTKSENQRIDEMKRLLLREKYHTAKRHLRPIAGGAPVVTCYSCSELLQLPVDFLLFKKRYHKLMCNGCKKVLKFSLLRGTHIVPYIDDTNAPPPSEADDYNNTTRHRNVEPPSRSSSCYHDPVSYSDDYGRSFCRSCSTEGEASAVLPAFDHVGRNSYNRKMSSVSSYNEPMQDRKMKGVLMESPNSGDSVGPSSRTPRFRKYTSEIEEAPPSSNSPLHRLMGYSSPSRVMRK